MKSTRRLLSIILCLIMCLSLLPTSAFAVNSVIAQGVAGMGTTFKLLEGGKLIISGYGTIAPMEQWSFDADGSYYWGADPWAGTRSETRELVIEEGVVAIGGDVFKNCPNLTSVTIPSSLMYVGGSAFENCSGLAAISFPGNVVYVGQKAFKGCVNLTDVMFVSGLQTIDDSAFEDCTKLASITFPANLRSIGERAFANCGSLKSITFLGNYDDTGSIGVAIADGTSAGAFVGVTADVFYPVDNNSWNLLLDPANPPYGLKDFGGRLTWKASAGLTHSEGWVFKNGGWYYYVDGVMIISNWKAFGGKWFYFGKDGKMVKGHVQIDGNYYYFGKGKSIDGYPEGARVSGLVAQVDDSGNPILDDSGNQIYYYYDDDGVWQPSYSGVDDNGLDYNKDGWQKSNDGKYFYIRNHAKVKGWLFTDGYWYYLDPTTGAMVTGWLTWKGKTYYLRSAEKAAIDGIEDKEGSMIADCTSEIGGVYYTFDKNGAVVAGGTTEFNPLGLVTGWKDESSVPSNPLWKFYKADGTMAVGWLKLNNTWYYFDKNGKMQTGWKNIGGVWYYLTKWEYSGSGDISDPTKWDEVTDPTATDAGKMVTGFNMIPYTKNGVNTVKTYYFKNSGALNGKGWIKVGLKWYFLEEDGVVVTGWFRDGSKWYYLDPTSEPIGEMVTGYVTTLADGSTQITDPDTGNPSTEGHSFKASGEWLGKGEVVTATKSGAWKQHEGYWYYYNANGDDYNKGNNNVVTGWQLLNGKWYYLEPTDPGTNPPYKGYMHTGFEEIDGEKYFFNNDGAAQGGWKKIDTVWYYFYPKHDGGFGRMLKGWQLIDGNWYYLDDTTGALKDGWFKVESGSEGEKQGFGLGWYLLNPDTGSNAYGAMVGGGWHQLYGKWYYFHNEADGSYGRLEEGMWIEGKGGKLYYVQKGSQPSESWMVTNGAYTIDGKVYFFGSNGVLQDPSGWKKSGDKWYYFDVYDSKTGVYTAVTSQKKNIDGEDYYFDENGVMQTGLQTVDGKKYFFNNDGAAAKKTWKTLDGKKYYFGNDGAAVTGEQTIDSKDYLFDSNGVMQTGFQPKGSKQYYYGDDGALKKGPAWLEVGADKYYIEDSTGALVENDFMNIDDGRYFFKETTCEMAKDEIVYNAKGSGYDYGFDETGNMLKDTTHEFNGETWSFDSEGHGTKL